MPSGLLPVVKPAGPSSASIVNHVKRLTRVKRIGHSGTLDPAADGVLVLATNRATRLFPYLISDKTYRATVRLGETTTTYDAQGDIEQRRAVPNVQAEALTNLLETFLGEQQQVPPMVSALHHQGKRLYELAREGKTVVREPRPITIHQIKLLTYQAPDLVFEVACSRGTYIRSLAFDLGEQLGCGAHLKNLTRTACNGFSLDHAVTLEQLEKATQDQTWQDFLLGPVQALGHLASWTLDHPEVKLVRNGVALSMPETLTLADEAVIALKDGDGAIVALAKKTEGQLKMVKVLCPANEDRL